MGISIGNRLLGTTGLSPGGGLSRGGGLSFGGFTTSLALNLNFLSGVLDPRITFSRPSLATYFDSTGKLTYAPNNLALRSEEFENSVWNAFLGVLPTATNIIAPDGTATADRFDYSASPAARYRYQSVTLSAPGNYILSLWVKAQAPAVFGLRFGSFSGATNTQAAISVGTTWQRVSLVATIAAGDLTGEVGFDQRSSVIPGVTDNAIIDVWGAQLEAVTYQTTPSTYIPTVASAYYGPRFEYDPVTLVPRGLLIEEARTNLLPQSDVLAAPWSTSGATRTVVTDVNPSGVASSVKLTVLNTSNVDKVIFNSSPPTASAIAYTASVFAKAAELSWIYVRCDNGGTPGGVYFNLATGVKGTEESGRTGTITPVGNGWYKLTVTATLTATTAYGAIQLASADNVRTFVGTVGQGVLIWGAQLEAGAFVTSYIPTGSTTPISRSADDVSMTGTNFTSWFNESQGTFIVQGDRTPTGGNNWFWTVVCSANQLDQVAGNTNVNFRYGGGANSNNILSSVIGTSPSRIASAYTLNSSFGISLDGSAVQTLTPALYPTVTATFRIGSQTVSAGFLNGHIAYIRYYNLRLPNADLQALTSPPLTPSMLMMFDTSSNSYIVSNWWS